MNHPARISLTALSAISALIAAPIVFASGASFALDGRGTYQQIVPLVFICSGLLLLVGIALLVTVVLIWRDHPQAPRFARGLAAPQCIVTVVALLLAFVANIQLLFVLLLFLGGVCSALLWFVLRNKK